MATDYSLLIYVLVVDYISISKHVNTNYVNETFLIKDLKNKLILMIRSIFILLSTSFKIIPQLPPQCIGDDELSLKNSNFSRSSLLNYSRVTIDYKYQYKYKICYDSKNVYGNSTHNQSHDLSSRKLN